MRKPVIKPNYENRSVFQVYKRYKSVKTLEKSKAALWKKFKIKLFRLWHDLDKTY